MPYVDIVDLPPPVRHALPTHAQEIFLAAFNAAWRTYADRAPHEREEIAHRVAWSAVKRRYRKVQGVWQPIDREGVR